MARHKLGRLVQRAEQFSNLSSEGRFITECMHYIIATTALAATPLTYTKAHSSRIARMHFGEADSLEKFATNSVALHIAFMGMSSL